MKRIEGRLSRECEMALQIAESVAKSNASEIDPEHIMWGLVYLLEDYFRRELELFDKFDILKERMRSVMTSGDVLPEDMRFSNTSMIVIGETRKFLPESLPVMNCVNLLYGLMVTLEDYKNLLAEFDVTPEKVKMTRPLFFNT